MANPFETWALDREIVLMKLLNHPRDKVFAAWIDPRALAEVGVFEGREQRFANLVRFLEIVPNERIVMDHGSPEPDDPDRFRVTVTFDEQTDGKTVLTMRQLHPSRERRRVVIGFGAVEYGLQTLDGLAAWLDG
ncbi:MAG: SRPBCC domain-containing protein [Sphingomonas sp.]|jgi:uncharacterized protein YndB with AHSA1/START domain|uniref:SRPBCC domain-containing protein n=1 Tax=Sphingomonas sp. TaxID=28214 RepID=UPI0035693355